MRTNLPVNQREHLLPEGELIVSTTDARGRITHCNRAFVEASGFSYEELLNQPHNLVRHPDMPPEAFKDLWQTIGRGRPWSGVVKNRRKNGEHYWVLAHVAPILEDGKPVAYLSVRRQASRAQIADAEALYRLIADERAAGRPTMRLHAGRVRRIGWRDLPGRLHRMTLTQRLLAVLAGAIGSVASAPWWLPGGPWAALALGLATTLGAAAWFHHAVQQRLDDAERFATDLAGCNLRSRIDLVHPHPLSGLARALDQIQINLRAIIGDTREAVDGAATTAAAIARGSQDLSSRTQAQAEALRHTAAAMQQLAGTVQQNTRTAEEAARQSRQTASAAGAGGDAMERVSGTMASIEQSSRQVAEIVHTIEGIAFQTNILALNAAVEAARAGEQGRGFAVVAGDVRALAQRCAQAAQEIGALIRSSASQVHDGTQQTAGARSTIGLAVSEVARVGSMIQHITDAAALQSQEIGQVNTSVTTLERMTQANAELVVDTADAVAALHQRTETLKRSVQLFRM